MFRYRKENDQIATPMSVEPLSGTPMSVDKSVMEAGQMHKTQAIMNDRDRFFDVAEYQMDILKYLKIVEVIFFALRFFVYNKFIYLDPKEYSSSCRLHEKTARHQ